MSFPPHELVEVVGNLVCYTALHSFWFTLQPYSTAGLRVCAPVAGSTNVTGWFTVECEDMCCCLKKEVYDSFIPPKRIGSNSKRHFQSKLPLVAPLIT